MNKFPFIKLCRNVSTIKSTNTKLLNYSVHKYVKSQSIPAPAITIKNRNYTNRYTRNRPSPPSSENSDKIPPKNNQSKKVIIIPEYWPNVPAIATTNDIIFPHFAKNIEITDPILIEIIRKKISLNEPYIGIFLKRDPENKSQIAENLDDIYHIGTFCHMSIANEQNNKLKLTINAIRRIRITNQWFSNDLEYLSPWLLHFTRTNQKSLQSPIDEPVLMVEIDNVTHHNFEHTPTIRALTKEIKKTIRDIIAKNPVLTEILETILQQNENVVSNIVYLCDFGAALTTAQPAKLQSIMEERNIEDRLMLTLSLLKEELETARLQEKITTEIEE